MPGVIRLEAARQIGSRAHVVFVTAFDQYAVEAFERGAIDYVLKPFNEERLATTVGRLKQRLAGAPPSLDALVEQLAERLGGGRQPEHLRWIKASVGSAGPADTRRGGALLPVRREVHARGHLRGRGAHPQAHPRAARRARSRALLADPPRDHRQRRPHRRREPRLEGPGRAEPARPPQTLTVSRAFTHLFKQM
jgi:hypothetical protein